GAGWGAGGGWTAGVPGEPGARRPGGEGGGLTPSVQRAAAAVVVGPGPQDGPVLVLGEYRVDPRWGAEFAGAVQALEPVRRRDGAFRWGIYHDVADPHRWLETFVVESWGEHLRQHERHTVKDRALEDLVLALVEGG